MSGVLRPVRFSCDTSLRHVVADLRGTAYGFFNLTSGLAMLLASTVAGLIWERLGAPFTFVAGAGFSAVTLLVIAMGAGALRV